ncbi:endonuclease/exonuclease/phosphatase family protein [Peribacillus sp. NPDC097675]|uniref:endonuclease/exonuclease/phosphatase family protein n=1 Tax=Peribacillus sp. NPDC097675 TaxID=3390618 RepID=UPI003D038A94
MTSLRRGLSFGRLFSKKKALDVKVMSFNIHHGVGIDGILDMERIARIVEVEGAEIIGLQEVDNQWSERSDFEDQAEWLAQRLNMHYIYMANIDRAPFKTGKNRRQYGAAILSAYPIVHAQNYLLTKIGESEQRGLLEIVIDIKGYKINVYNTHLALTANERHIQLNEIIQISHAKKGPKVLMGDFNTTPQSKELLSISSHYNDAFADQNEAYTYDAEGIPKRIDYIFTSKEIKTSQAKVIYTPGSDHYPIIVTLTLN